MPGMTQVPGEFMGGPANAAIPMNPNYGVPGPTAVNIEGSGGAPSPGAGLLSGIAAGQNLANNAVATYRGGKDYKAGQAARQTSGDATGMVQGLPSPSQDNAHQGFIASLGQGLQHLGSGIASFFQPGAGGGIPGLEKGGEMPDFMTSPASGSGGAIVPASVQGQQPPSSPTGGQYRGFADGGPVPANYGVPGPAQVDVQGTAGAPNPGAAALSGVAAGQNLANNAVAAARGGAQYSADQSARQAAAGAVPDMANPTTGDHVSAIDDFASHLHDGALNDAGAPNGQQALPTAPGPGAAVQAAATNPAAQQGIPEDRPKNAHSLTPEYWDESDRKIAAASKAAALAGHDPTETFNALSNMRTSFVQGHILRNLAAANVALANGDMGAVEKGLKDVNYYLPNGQDLKLQKDANGALVYQDPIAPWLDKDGNASATKAAGSTPNIIPVDAAHLQMLGTAALDPMKVNDLVMGARAAIAKQRLEESDVQTRHTTAQGALYRGMGILKEGEARLGTVPSQNYKNLSGADLDRARAAHLGWLDMQLKNGVKALKLDPAAERGAENAAKEVDSAIQGQLSTVPLQIKDKKGNLVDNLSPMAGKSTRDPARSLFPNATPEQVMGMKATAGDLFLSNSQSGMSAQQAAQIAVKIEQGKRGTHPGPNGQAQPNVMIDRAKGVGHVWDNKTKTWTPFRIGQARANSLVTNGGEAPSADSLMADQDAMSGSSSAAEGGIPTSPGEDEEAAGGGSEVS